MANPNWKKGVSGNPKGRKPKPEIEELRKALAKAAKEMDCTFIEHLVLRAYKNDTVAIAVAKKILPDLSSIDGDIKSDLTIAGLADIIQRAKNASKS